MARITGRPPTAKVADQDLRNHLDLIWDALLNLDQGLAAIVVPDTASLQQSITAEKTLRQALERRVTALERVPPIVKVSRSTNQAIATPGNFQIAYDAAVGNSTGAGMWSSSLPSRLTIGRAGWYLVACRVRYAADAVGTFRAVSVILNGDTASPLAADEKVPNAIVKDLEASILHRFAVGDYIETNVSHNGTNPLNVLASADFSPRMWAMFVSDAA